MSMAAWLFLEIRAQPPQSTGQQCFSEEPAPAGKPFQHGTFPGGPSVLPQACCPDSSFPTTSEFIFLNASGRPLSFYAPTQRDVREEPGAVQPSWSVWWSLVPEGAGAGTANPPIPSRITTSAPVTSRHLSEEPWWGSGLPGRKGAKFGGSVQAPGPDPAWSKWKPLAGRWGTVCVCTLCAHKTVPRRPSVPCLISALLNSGQGGGPSAQVGTKKTFSLCRKLASERSLISAQNSAGGWSWGSA